MTIISDPAKALALDQEEGAIEEVNPLLQPRGFYSPILDLHDLNQYLKVLPFHMLTTGYYRQVLQTIAKGDWFTSIDLKDAYFHVPIALQHRRFLRFAYRGRHWQFRVLPFGLSLSPRVFTRCMMTALAPLQAQRIKVLPYLDDWVLFALFHAAPLPLDYGCHSPGLQGRESAIAIWRKKPLDQKCAATSWAAFRGVPMEDIQYGLRHPGPHLVHSPGFTGG